MATPPKNRIEVDLKLLSDKDTKLLKEFIGEIKTLNSKLVFGSVAQQMAGAATVVNAGQAGGPYLSQAWKQRHAQTDPGKYSRDVASNYDQTLREKLTDQLRKSTYSPSHLKGGKDMEFLNLSRYGDFTVQDILKQISYGLGKFGFHKTEVDANGEPLVTHPVIANASGVFGMAAHSYPAFRSGQKIATRIRNHLTGQQAYGLSVGQPGAGSGIAGTPFMSPAYRTGLSTSWNKFKETAGGMNPNYSGAQFTDAASATASYGYDTGSARGQYFQSQIATLQRSLGLSGEQAASMLDPSMRFGTNSVSTLANSLVLMGRAAGQAGVNTQQLTLAAQQYGDQLSQQFGGFSYQRQAQVAGLGTILSSPQTGGALATDPMLNNMIVAQKGSYFKAAFSTTKQQDTMHAFQTYMKPFGSFAQMGNTLKNGTGAQKDALMSNLIAMGQQGMIPGGMSATQFATQLMRGGDVLQKSAQSSDLLNLASQQNFHLSGPQLQRLEKNVVGGNWKQWASDHANQSAKDRITALSTEFGKQQQKSTSQAGYKVQIALAPQAAKYLKAAISKEQGMSPHSNGSLVSTAENYAGDAFGIAQSVAQYIP